MRIGLAVLAIAISACDADFDFDLGDETVGDRGFVTFTYSGLNCILGCALDTPLLAGEQQELELRSGSAIASADVFPDGVATVTTLTAAADSPNAFVGTIGAVAAGSTVLHVFSPDGALLDFTEIDVADLHAIEIALSLENEGRLKPGATGYLTAQLLDDQGRTLLGTPAITWRIVEGEARIALSVPPSNTHALDTVTSFQALAPGPVVVAADTASGVRDEITFEIE